MPDGPILDAAKRLLERRLSALGEEARGKAVQVDVETERLVLGDLFDPDEAEGHAAFYANLAAQTVAQGVHPGQAFASLWLDGLAVGVLLERYRDA